MAATWSHRCTHAGQYSCTPQATQRHRAGMRPRFLRNVSRSTSSGVNAWVIRKAPDSLETLKISTRTRNYLRMWRLSNTRSDRLARCYKDTKETAWTFLSQSSRTRNAPAWSRRVHIRQCSQGHQSFLFCCQHDYTVTNGEEMLLATA